MANINPIKTLKNKPLIYSVNFDEDVDRLDCTWFNPEINKKIKEIEKLSEKKLKISLNKISKVSGGKRLPKDTVLMEDENHYIPYVRGVDVKELKVNIEKTQKITKEIHKLIQNYQLKKNDLVVSIVGTIGNVGILDEDVEVCDFTENIAKVRVFDEKINHKYLLYYLDSDLAKVQFEKFSVGSLQYKLSLNSLRNNIKFIVPSNKDSYSESKQNSILKKIEDSFLKADKMKLEANKIIDKANNFLLEKLKIKIPSSNELDFFKTNLGDEPDRLDALFNNPKRDLLKENIKKYFSWDFLENIIEFEEDKKVAPSEYYNLIDLSDINEKIGKITSSREVSDLGSQKVLLKNNTILISKLQPEQGKIVIVDNNFSGSVASSELIPIRVKKEGVSLEYLWVVLRSQYTLKQWAYSLTGSSRMRIGKTEINETVIPIPSESERKIIVKQVFNLFKEADEIIKESEEIKEKAKQELVKILIN